MSISTLCWCICLVLTAWINQKKKQLEKTKAFTRSKACVTVNARSLKMVSTKESKEEIHWNQLPELSILWSFIHILSLSFSFFSFPSWNTLQSIASNYQKQRTKQQQRHYKQNQKILSPNFSIFLAFQLFPF